MTGGKVAQKKERTGPVQDAKARFSELLEASITTLKERLLSAAPRAEIAESPRRARRRREPSALD